MTPIEGRNHLLAVEYKGASQVPTWYIGLYEGDYTPTDDVTAATLPGLATECTAYSESTRVPFVPGTVAAGAVSNAASLARFTFNAPKTIHGTFMTSASAKGSTSGVLASVVRFPSPRTFAAGDTLDVFAGPNVNPIP